jgi:hypothetical protein
MNSNSKPAAPALSKRKFVDPTLRVYGTVADLTETVNRSGRADGSSHTKNNMTTPPGRKM